MKPSEEPQYLYSRERVNMLQLAAWAQQHLTLPSPCKVICGFLEDRVKTTRGWGWEDGHDEKGRLGQRRRCSKCQTVVGILE